MDKFLDKLNDIEIDLSEYDEILLNDIEKKKMKKRIKSKIVNKNNKSNNLLKVVALIAVIMVSPVLINAVPATIKLISEKIETVRDNDIDLHEYKDIVDQTATNGEYTVQLNEIMFDADALLVSTTIKKNEGELPIETQEDSDGDREHNIYLTDAIFNGEKISHAGGIHSKTVDSSTYTSVFKMYYDKDIKVEGDGQLELRFTNGLVEAKDYENITFTLNVNADKMKKVINSVDVNKDILFDGKKEFSIDEITTSPETLIIESTLKNNSIYQLSYEVKDNLGNIYTAPFTTINNNVFTSISLCIKAKEANKLTVIPLLLNTNSGETRRLEEEKFEIPINQG